MKKTLALAVTVGLVSGCASFDRNSGLVAGAIIGGATEIGGTAAGGAVVGGVIGAALGSLAEKSEPAASMVRKPIVVPEKAAEPEVQKAPADDTYTVVRGDNLWTISAKESIYGNPYQWPLIYKANRDQIRDADLIYPDQVLTIKRDSSQSDIDAAVAHARTRGAWSMGTVEQVDLDYLAK